MATSSQTFANRRIDYLACIFFLLFLVVTARLIDVQLLRRDEFRRLAQRFHERRRVIPAMRGTICDRTGRELATNIPTMTVVVDVASVKDVSVVVNGLASALNTDRQKLFNRINPAVTSYRAACALYEENKKRHFPERMNPRPKTRVLTIQRKIPYALGARIRDMEIKGVSTNTDSRRYYPNGRLASQLLGHTNIDGVGQEGLEKVLEKGVLKGHDGLQIYQVDGKRQVISETRQVLKDKQDGCKVTLTIDERIQYNVERELEKAFIYHGASGASAVVLDVKTGEILAMANMPIYDPNKPATAPKGPESKEAKEKRIKREGAARRNRAVTDLYEPGSTLKILTMAAALEENVNTNAYCVNSMPIGRRRIHCAHGQSHGAGNYEHIIQHSCNIGAATVGLRLGPTRLYKYAKKFGLLDKPGTGLPGELGGWLGQPETWPDIRTANVAFGQGIAVTPIQMASLYATIANGGVLMKPQILREIRKPDGTVVSRFKPVRVRRVVSKETAQKISHALEMVVMDGTGRNAKIAGYYVAGKTGTAQKARTDGKGKGFLPGKYIGSFVGFLPARNPRVAILVTVDEPTKGGYYGGVTAGPVFREIARNLMWHLNIPPDDPLDKSDGAKPGSFREWEAAHKQPAPSLANEH